MFVLRYFFVLYSQSPSVSLSLSIVIVYKPKQYYILRDLSIFKKPLPPPQKIFGPTPFSIPLSYFSSKCFKSFLSDERSAPKHACLENTQVSARTENVGSTVGWVNMYKICEQKCTKTWKIEFLTRPDMKIALSNSFQKGVLNLCRKYLHKIIFPQNWGFF